MAMLTTALQNRLDCQSILTEEFLKRTLYQELDEAEAVEGASAEDSLVGLFDLGAPLLSEKSEEILQALFAKELE